jgi:hypothetical protein
LKDLWVDKRAAHVNSFIEAIEKSMHSLRNAFNIPVIVFHTVLRQVRRDIMSEQKIAFDAGENQAKCLLKKKRRKGLFPFPLFPMQ